MLCFGIVSCGYLRGADGICRIWISQGAQGVLLSFYGREAGGRGRVYGACRKRRHDHNEQRSWNSDPVRSGADGSVVWKREGRRDRKIRCV